MNFIFKTDKNALQFLVGSSTYIFYYTVYDKRELKFCIFQLTPSETMLSMYSKSTGSDHRNLLCNINSQITCNINIKVMTVDRQRHYSQLPFTVNLCVNKITHQKTLPDFYVMYQMDKWTNASRNGSFVESGHFTLTGKNANMTVYCILTGIRIISTNNWQTFCTSDLFQGTSA